VGVKSVIYHSQLLVAKSCIFEIDLADNNYFMNNVLVGREAEIGIMERLLNSKEPELLAIYGRGRPF
jgi:hypothetical protein